MSDDYMAFMQSELKLVNHKYAELLAENSKLREQLKISKEYLNKFLISDENKERLEQVETETLLMLVLHSAYVAEEGLAKLGEDV